MHRATFFPLGNADTCRLDLECGKKLLFDFAHWKDAENEGDLRIDLAESLRDALEADSFNVVAFTHVDDDHIHGAIEFFYLDHAQKYQSDDRIKIEELWVPAAVIIEEGLEGLIHVSELREGSLLHPRNVVQEGEPVRVRIIHIDALERRLGLSLRQVSQNEQDEPEVQEASESSEALPSF